MVKGKRDLWMGILCVFVMTVISVIAFPIGTVAQTVMGEDTDIIHVEGADKKSEEALEELEENQGVILFAENSNTTDLKGVAKDKVVLTYSKKVRYENFFTRNYRVKYDGKTKIAYCVQPKEDPPSPGSWTAKEYNNKLMKKALYYAYGYPGYDKRTSSYLSKKNMDDDYEDDEGAYALSHLVLSYFYDKQSMHSDAFLGVSNNTKKLIKMVADKIENDWPAVPDDSTLSLNKTAVKAQWDAKEQVQKTPTFQLKGHEDNRISVTVPAYATMHKKSDGVSKKYYRGKDNSKTVKVYGGDSFYFTAPASVQGSFTSAKMTGNLTDFQPYIISVTGKQNIVFCGVGEKDSVSFSIEWDKVSLFTLNKSSDATSITDGNQSYSLQGASYGIYKKDGTLYQTVMTDEKGNAEATLPYDTYYIHEERASKGYALDTKQYKIVVKGEKKTLQVKETPQVNLIHMVLQKQDADLKEVGKAQGAAALKGAQYKVSYYSGYYNDEDALSGKKPLRSWVVETDKEGKAYLSKDAKVSGDEFYFNAKKQIVLPLGTVTIQEVKAPEGYELDKSVYVRKITSEGSSALVNTYNPVKQKEQVIRGDLKFVKKGGNDKHVLAGVDFTITAKSTGESKQIVTDADGEFSSAKSDLWFGAESEKTENVGKLPYDTYIIKELRSEKNVGLQLIEPVEVVIKEPSVTVDLGELVDQEIKIHTVAIDKETKEKYITAGKDAKIQDSILYDGLEKGEEYTAKGTLVDQKTGEVLQINGKDVIGETTFRPNSGKGVVTVDFTLDASGLGGTSLVVYESLYQKGVLVAEHKDQYSETQTVRVVKQEAKEAVPAEKEKNTPTNTPATGDDNNLALLGIVAVAAFLLMLVAVFLKKRKSEKHKS